MLLSIWPITGWQNWTTLDQLSEAVWLIFPRPSIALTIISYFINYNCLTLLLSCWTGVLISCTTDIYVSNLDSINHLADLSTLVSHEVQNLALFSFLITSEENTSARHYKSIHQQSDNKLRKLLPIASSHKYNLRNPRTYPLFKCRTEGFKNSFIPKCVSIWDWL